MSINKKQIKFEGWFIFKKPFVIIGLICLLGLVFRIYFFTPDIPVTHDSNGYFWYAIETSITGSFPTVECEWKCTFPNTGWPSFLSIFFTIFSFDNYLDYMNLQRYLGIIISVVTVIPLFYFCKVFVGKKYAIIGSMLFAFNPRIIENSILGTTEPMYILGITLMLYTFFQHGKNYAFITFGIIGIISIIRYEGLLLFVPFSLLYFYKFKFSKKSIQKYCIAVAIFLLITISWGMMKIDLTGQDGMISHVVAGPNYYNDVIKESHDPNEAITSFLNTGFNNMLRFSVLATLPILTFLIPFGIYIMISKKDLSNFLILFCITLTLLLPVFYAYSRSFQDVRYLLPIFPIFCLFSVYFIRNITEKIKYKKTFLILFTVIVISSSIGFIEFKNADDVNKVEVYEFSKVIYSTVSIANYFSHEEYLDSIRMESIEEFPILRKDLPKGIPIIYIDHSINYNNLEEFIEKNRSNGLTHIIVDKGDSRTGFFDDVYQNEEKYLYLTKIFDTFENGYKDYHAKIFEINFNKFDELK